jgi:CRP/FNR family transcriptional regulator, cyclic AMP receptor protein
MSDNDATAWMHFDEDELRALAAQGVVKSFPRNAVIVSEGDDTDTLYIILSGRVQVFVSDEEGKEVVLRTEGPGEYFGEIVLDGGPRSASVMALEPSRFAVIPRDKVRDFLRTHPNFSVHLMEKLARRIRVLTESVESLALMDVYGRVARLLLELAAEEDGRIVIHEKLTQLDIASRVGASREMISRIFKDLSSGGYITVDSRPITIDRTPPRHWQGMAAGPFPGANIPQNRASKLNRTNKPVALV